MNIKTKAKEWLIQHEHYEHEPSFNDDLESLLKLIESVAYYEGFISDALEYEETFGDNKTCECGCPYYRHFDTYSNMDAVGCKYCYHGDHYGDNCCAGFRERK
jgi:hypothetical protein